MTTYNPRSVFQSYDQYGRAKKKQASKTNPGKQFADSMKAGGGGRNMSGIGAKPASSRTSTFDQFKRRERNRGLVSRPSFGGAQDNNPNRDEAENKSSVKKLYEKTVNFLKSFGADEPEAIIVDGQKVYQGPAFRGFTPTVPTENFGGEYGKKRYLLGIPQLGETIRSPVSPTLPPSDKNPTLNMFGVKRGFTRDPNPVMSPPTMTQPEKPRGLMGIPRALARANAVPTVPTAAYQVQSGDTLSEIAAATGTTVKELADLNQISDVDVIEAGADIQIPIKRLEDEAIVTQATSMEELEPIKASYTIAGAVGAGLMKKPKVKKLNVGDNVDFNFIGEQEGVGIKKGYIPKEDGKVLDNSGVTIGTGVDLGSKNDAYFKGLSEEIKAKLRPHYGKKRNAAVASLKANPLTLTSAQVAELDTFVKTKEINNLKSKWNKDSNTDFDSLPKNKATAVASVYFQYGNKMIKDHKFWKQVTSGDWEAALDNLRDYEDKYPSRRNREADYLESGEL